MTTLAWRWRMARGCIIRPRESNACITMKLLRPFTIVKATWFAHSRSSNRHSRHLPFPLRALGRLLRNTWLERARAARLPSFYVERSMFCEHIESKAPWCGAHVQKYSVVVSTLWSNWRRYGGRLPRIAYTCASDMRVYTCLHRPPSHVAHDHASIAAQFVEQTNVATCRLFLALKKIQQKKVNVNIGQ